MSKPFKLPDLGEGIHEGEVLAVRVEVGQNVKEGDIILEVETDKAAVEIPSPYTGAVSEVLVRPGDVVQVGQVMMRFADGTETQSAKEPEPPGREAGVPPRAPVVEEKEGKGEAPPVQTRTGPVPASPATRRIARELGVDLRLVTPTGPAGLVTAEDVRAFAQTGPAGAVPQVPPEPGVAPPRPVPAPEGPLPDFAKWGPVRRVPFRSVRKATARQMALAWSQIPHVTSHDVADITDLDAFRRKHRERIETLGGKLTLTVFALKAAATALKAHPHFNASLDLEGETIVLKDYLHIGVAVDTDSGLIVPVVRDVDRKSIAQLAVELHELVQKTRSRKATLEDLQGGTFTITNAGAMGGQYFAPIINHPQVAILGMGQGRLQPVVKEKGGRPEIVPRLMMPIVLCIDHRVLDGADAMRFLSTLIRLLEDPEEMLIGMV